MSKRTMKGLLTIIMTLVMIFVLAPKTMAAETEIGNSETKEGADAYTLMVNQEYVTALNGAERYISFVTPEQGGFVLISVQNKDMSETLNYYITDASGKEIGKYSVSYGSVRALEYKSEKNYANKATLASNTRYYIQLGEAGSQSNGNVAVSVKFSEDDCPDGMVGAKPISPNVIMRGSLDGVKTTDADWYIITGAQSDYYRIFLKNISMKEEIRLQLYDEFGQWVMDKNGSWAHAAAKSWGDGEDSIGITLDAGKKYYLEVTGGKGEYSLNVNCQKVEAIHVENSVTMKWGEIYELKYTVSPDTAYNQHVKFESDNLDVATVDNDGKVTASTAGKAVITLTAVDGSGTTAQCIVYVKPKAPYHLKGSKSTLDTIKLTWSGAENATGYNIFQKKDGKWKKIGSTKKKSFTVKKLKHMKGYQFRIQAYMKLDGKTFTSEKSDTAYYATRPKPVNITKITRMKSKKRNGITYYYAKIKWKKMSGIKKYRVYGKLASNGKMEYIGEYKQTSAEVVLQYGGGSKKCTFYVFPVFTYKGEEYTAIKAKGKVYTFK